MSLILEALKKSEAQRRLGEAPGLGTPITATRRRRSSLPWLIVVVVTVAAVGGWWVWLRAPAQPTPTASVSSPSAPAKSAQSRPRATPGNITAMAPPEADRRDRPERRAGEAAPAAAHPPGPPSSLTTAAPPPNPVRAQVPAPAPGSSTSATPPVGASGGPVAPPAASAPLVAPAVPAAIAPQRDAATDALPAAAVPVPAAAVPAAATPAYADVQNIDDLPYNLRKDVPDLPISMQVYSPDPARRFIIMSGNRKVEGDTIKDGVVLREVRPNGVVLEFRGQRFFLSRPGA